MKKSTIILLGIELFLSTMFLINAFVININDVYIMSSFLIVNILLVIYFLGYEKHRQRLKKDAILTALIFSSLLQIILYMFGLLFGFLKSGYSMQPIMIVKNVFPLLLLIITEEILRYTINQKGSESKTVLIASCITFVIIECTIQGLFYDFADKKSFIELICLVILPSISKNIYLTYNTTKFGFPSSVVYRIVMELTIYFTPILPNISDYLTAIISFLFPIFVLVITKNTIGKVAPYEEVIYKKVSRVPLFGLIIFIFCIIILNTGLAPFYILAIGSGSMEKTIYRGDAVIVQKVSKDKIDTLSEGDILVYNYQNKVIVHRIYSIELKEDDIYI